MTRRIRAAGVLVAAVLVAGCGDDGPGGATGRTTAAAPSTGATAPVRQTSDSPSLALLQRVPGDAYALAAMDLALAKAQAGADADLDPADYRERQDSGDPDGVVDDAALKLMGYLTGVGATKAAAAIDHGAVTAAAHARQIGGELLLLATPQPRATIAAGLRRAGFTPVGGGVYATGEDDPAASYSAVGFGPGIVALGTDADVVSGALARRVADPRVRPLLTLMARTRGALRTARRVTGGGTEEGSCVTALAGAGRFGPEREPEDLILALDRAPRQQAVRLGTASARADILTRGYRVLDVRPGRRELVLKIGPAADALDSDNAATIADGTLEIRQIYRCPGAPPAVPEADPGSPAATFEDIPDPPEPDTSGNRFEDAVSAYVSAGSTARTAVRVRCPGADPGPGRKIRCTGTRREGGRTYRYTLTVNLGQGSIRSVDIDSPDDRTGTVVPK